MFVSKPSDLRGKNLKISMTEVGNPPVTLLHECPLLFAQQKIGKQIDDHLKDGQSQRSLLVCRSEGV